MLCCTCIWLNSGEIISIGSSTVHTLTSAVASRFRVEYRVVVLPEPVGPVTSTIPCGRSTRSFQPSASSALKPSCSMLRNVTSGSKMRSTHFSPNAVGMVETRISTSRPPGERVLIRPSCGRRRSPRSIRDSTLIRLVAAVITGGGISNTLCSMPSMRKRTRPTSRRGSRWMSLARCSCAYCSSQSTMWTMCWSSALTSPVRPSSTSCSKLGRPLPSRTLRASLRAPCTDWITPKNCMV